MNIEKIIKEKQGTIIDVRTPAEFMGGNIAGSINIPLQEIPQRIEELKNLKTPFCCAAHQAAEADKHTTILHSKVLNVTMAVHG